MNQEQIFQEDLSETPSVLRYSEILKVGTPLADLQYNTFIPSNGSTFKADQSIRLPFNCPTDSFLNLKGAYIKFKIKNVSAGADEIVLDPQAGGASVIDTFRVISGTGALLEEVVHYNAIYALMNSMVPTTHTHSSNNLQEGTTKAPLIVKSQVAGADGNSCQVISKGNSFTCTHVPMSGFFNCDRLAPLGFTNGTSYVELQLSAQNTAFRRFNTGAVGDIDWEISEVEMVCPVLRMGAEFNASFRQILASGIPINWHSTSYHNVQTSVSSGSSGSITLTTASRKRSVKSVITIFRKQADLTDKAVDSVSCRRSLGLTEYSYTLGGLKMPSKSIKVAGVGAMQTTATAVSTTRDVGEAYANLVMCLSNLGNVYSGTAMNADDFYLSDNAGASKIAYGLDLEAYGHSNVQSGKNLAGQGLPLVFECTLAGDNTNIASSSAVLCDQFLLYDVVYTLDGVSGTITANA